MFWNTFIHLPTLELLWLWLPFSKHLALGVYAPDLVWLILSSPDGLFSLSVLSELWRCGPSSRKDPIFFDALSSCECLPEYVDSHAALAQMATRQVPLQGRPNATCERSTWPRRPERVGPVAMQGFSFDADGKTSEKPSCCFSTGPDRPSTKVHAPSPSMTSLSNWLSKVEPSVPKLPLSCFFVDKHLCRLSATRFPSCEHFWRPETHAQSSRIVCSARLMLRTGWTRASTCLMRLPRGLRSQVA